MMDLIFIQLLNVIEGIGLVTINDPLVLSNPLLIPMISGCEILLRSAHSQYVPLAHEK
jgi:hypothetical protein